MPIPFFVVTSLLFLFVPLYAMTVILCDNQTRPHQRNINALGGGLLLKLGAVAGLIVFSWTLHQETSRWFPLVLLGLFGLATHRLMLQTSLKH